ncbi:MAG: Solute carrier family 35 member, partial [Streblomastix strix]
MANRAPLAAVIFYMSMFLIFGAANSLLSKLLYKTTSVNFYGVETPFEKPNFQNWAMFVGMMSVFVPEFLRRCYVRRKEKEDEPSYGEIEPLILKETNGGYLNEQQPKQRDWTWLKIIVPGLCDMTATLMMNAALVNLPVSIWQMLRGSIIIFTALLTVFYRKRCLYMQQWIGVAAVVIAIVMLGIAATLTSAQEGDTSKKTPIGLVLIGCILVIFAQAIQGFQTIVEETLLHDSTTPPMTVVGWEGFWGFMMCTFFMVPLTYFIRSTPGNGLTEDFIDTWVMLSNNYLIIIFAVGFFFSILMFNVFGMFIINSTSALTRNVLDPMRTLVIWIVSVI